MNVTGKKYTDFFVFTFKGWHKERIYFDPKFGLMSLRHWFGSGISMLVQS